MLVKQHDPRLPFGHLEDPVEERSRKLLLVEDEALIAFNEKMQLEKIGYSVDHVLTGEAAVSRTLNPDSRSDLVLMDIDLGNGIDGTQAAEQILNEIEIPIVFLSSRTEPEVVAKTEKITSYGYVVKNSGLTVLDASIKMAFKLFGARVQRTTEKTVNWASANYLRSILQTTQDGFALIGMQGQLLDVNNAYCEMCGYSREELLQLSIPDIDADEIPQRPAERFEMIKSAGHLLFETQNRRKDGTTFDVEVSASFLKEEEPKIVAFFRDVTKRKQAEEEIQRQLAEKETLLREVHHRIKNNMAQIESLLSIQADSAESAEVKAALNTTMSRVRTTRTLYEKLLVGKDHREVSVKDYLESLIESHVEVYNDNAGVTVETSILDFSFSAKKAVPVGIILNELLTNVFKYAFGDRAEGRVDIELKKNEKQVTLTVQDNGVGFDSRVAANKSTGFGLTLTKMLAEQLDGTFNMESDNGTKSVVTFEV